MSSERYEIRGKIGQGGVGAVYRAYDKNLSREVAIKRVLTEEGFDANDEEDEATKALLKEATALCSVQHPHIVTVYDAGVDEDGPYVVMELLSGRTLDEMVERGTMTWSDFRETAVQSLEALIAAQDLDLVHRDIKPSNVMVTWLPSGKFQVKLVDFGLAKFSSKPSLQTIDHGDAVFGSIHFMAPEQFERVPLDKRTDMYSLGCVFYFSLAGVYPFDGENAPLVMAAHLQNNYTPLREHRPDLPDWVCQWVEWHLARAPDDRPSSAREALERFLSFEQPNGQAPVNTEAVPASSLATGALPDSSQRITGPVPLNVANATGPVPVSSATGPQLLTGTQTGPVQTGSPQTGQVPTVPAQTGPVTGGANVPANQIPTGPPKNNTLKYVIIGALVAGLVVTGIILAQVLSNNSKTASINGLMEEAVKSDVATVKVDGPLLNEALEKATDLSFDADKGGLQELLVKARATDKTDINREIKKVALESQMTSKQREQLFDVLARREATEMAAPLLSYATSAGNPADGAAAIRSAAKLMDAQQLPKLYEIIASKKDNVLIKAAEDAAVGYLSQNEVNEVRAKELLPHYDNAGDLASKAVFMRLLGATSSKAVWPKIKEALKSDEQLIKGPAFFAAGSWKDDSVFAELAKAVNAENDSFLREQGIDAVFDFLTNEDVEFSAANKRLMWSEAQSLVRTSGEKNIFLQRLATTCDEDWAQSLVRPYISDRDSDVSTLARDVLSQLRE